MVYTWLRLTRWRTGVLIALPVVLLACGGSTNPTAAPTAAPAAPTALASPTVASARTVTIAATTTRVPAGTATRTAAPNATVTRGTVNYPDVVRMAIESLAAETGLPRDQIVVSRFEAREWPDSSLGCPQPGRTYLQVITPGYRFFLSAGGREYEYHTNQTAMIVRCAS